MSDPNNMTCQQLEAAIAAETDPAKKTELEMLYAKKGCGAQTNDDSGGHGPTPPPPPPPNPGFG